MYLITNILANVNGEINKMVKKSNKVVTALAAVGVAIGLAASGIGGALIADDSTQVAELNAQIEALNITVEPVIEYVDVEVPVNVTVETMVEVDNGNLDLVLEELYDNDGSVEYLIYDLDDDELDLIVDRIVMAQDFKSLAIAEVKSELFDELDNEDVVLADNSTLELDDGDMERLRIDDDSDEVILSSVDYDDQDADVTVTGTFEQDDIKFDYEVLVEIKDGEVSDFDIVSVIEA
jgi:outer membrane murein-binding lipoprotein Lpp